MLGEEFVRRILILFLTGFLPASDTKYAFCVEVEGVQLNRRRVLVIKFLYPVAQGMYSFFCFCDRNHPGPVPLHLM